ncbi:MAG: anti-sigma factor [Hyphomicrobiales bacterium]|nr:anti-sigma factor [Hyphomicrobiales bacterium]MBV8661987.1 anti-sigma factor [Hyphomicrobiales bacterium]
MTVSPEDDGAAAEFALGTLDAGERAALAARRLREPELDAAIRAWEELLAPLAEAAGPIVPPRDEFAAIEARLRASDPVVALQRRLARWRAAAIGAASLAAMLGVGVVLIETIFRAPPVEFTAFLQKNAEAPAFVVAMDPAARELTVRPLGAAPPPGKSYELWLIEPRLGPPRSLGVISPAGVTRPKFAAFDLAIAENATYAVTLEPPGGSPNGAPSGPPVFVGKLVRVTE